MDSSLLLILPQVWSFIFVEDFLRYFISAGLLAWMITHFAGWSERNKIQSVSATLEDRKRELKHSLSTIVVFSFIGVSIFLLSESGVAEILQSPVSGTELLLQSLVLIIGHDTYFYWLHRAMHGQRALRRVHALHHRSKTPSPWAAYSFSLSEAVLEAAYLPLIIVFVPVHPIAMFVFTSHMILRNVIGHAGVEVFPSWWLRNRFTRWITTTTHHDMHHSEYGHNFGLYFRWWDQLMGTEHPDYEERFLSIKRQPRTQQRSQLPGPTVMLLLGLAIIVPVVDVSAADQDISGIWVPEHAKHAVELKSCGVRICAQLSNEGLAQNTLTDTMLDTKNQRRRLRDRKLLGLQIGSLKRTGARGLYKGTVYLPELGTLYTTKIRRLDNGSLKIRACQSHRCRTFFWWRPKSGTE